MRKLNALRRLHLTCNPGDHQDCTFCKQLREWEDTLNAIHDHLEPQTDPRF